MEAKHLLKNISQIVLFVTIGIFARILPHPSNFAPIGAIALFGGSYFNKKLALTIPLITMIVSDFVIGFDSIPMRLTVYFTFVLIGFIGIWLKNHSNLKNIVAASLFSSVLFFIITNFSVWAFGTMYTKDVSGLINCYVFAIPFFRNTVLGDIFYTGLFFGGYNFLTNISPLWVWGQKV